MVDGRGLFELHDDLLGGSIPTERNNKVEANCELVHVANIIPNSADTLHLELEFHNHHSFLSNFCRRERKDRIGSQSFLFPPFTIKEISEFFFVIISLRPMRSLRLKPIFIFLLTDH